MISWSHACVLSLAAALAAGCAEHMALLARGPNLGASTSEFWPPPRATAVWTTPARRDATLGDAADRVARALHDAGYGAQRAYPIGVGWAHGFAITTRLERIDDAFALRVHAYEYASSDDDGDGAFVADDARRPPDAQLRASGLASLAP